MKDLPVYKITIDDEYGEGEDLKIDMIAFTARPAIKVKGMAFNEDKVKKMSFKDDVKQRIVAPYMIPMQIYRSDIEEYMVEFTVEEIDALHSKFMMTLAQGNGSVFNDEHDSSKIVPAYILHTWVVEDPKTDVAFTKYGIEVPKGTMMLTTQIVEKSMYEYLIKEDMLGYSIEGMLGLKLSEVKKDLKLSCDTKSCGCGGPTEIEMAGGMPRYRKRDLPPFHDNCRCRFVDNKIVANVDACDYCRERIKTLNINMSENKNKETEMEEKKLVAGEYPLPDGTVLVVKEDGSCEIIEKKVEELADEAKPEDKKEEVPAEEVKKKEEELADEVKPEDEEAKKKEEEMADEVPAEAQAVNYTKEEIDAKFEELYKVIADLKVEKDDVKDEDVAEPMKMSVHDRFSEYVRFSRKDK